MNIECSDGEFGPFDKTKQIQTHQIVVRSTPKGLETSLLLQQRSHSQLYFNCGLVAAARCRLENDDPLESPMTFPTQFDRSNWRNDSNFKPETLLFSCSSALFLKATEVDLRKLHDKS